MLMRILAFGTRSIDKKEHPPCKGREEGKEGPTHQPPPEEQCWKLYEKQRNGQQQGGFEVVKPTRPHGNEHHDGRNLCVACNRDSKPTFSIGWRRQWLTGLRRLIRVLVHRP